MHSFIQYVLLIAQNAILGGHHFYYLFVVIYCPADKLVRMHGIRELVSQYSDAVCVKYAHDEKHYGSSLKMLRLIKSLYRTSIYKKKSGLQNNDYH